MSSNSWWYVL